MRRAAISPDYLDFNDHAYATMQVIILRTLSISMVSLKTGLASLTYCNNQLFNRSYLSRISLMYLLSKGKISCYKNRHRVRQSG